MKQYTREDIIAELAQNVSVSWVHHCTWNIRSYIGHCADHYVKVSEITHNEDDETGIFDGETYNPQDYEEWLYYSCDDEVLTKEEKKELFEKHCESVWSDSANEDNYEPREHRDLRLAERLFDSLIEDDRIVICKDGYLVLDEKEEEFLSNNTGWMEKLYEGKLDEFAEAFEEWENQNLNEA